MRFMISHYYYRSTKMGTPVPERVMFGSAFAAATST